MRDIKNWSKEALAWVANALASDLFISALRQVVLPALGFLWLNNQQIMTKLGDDPFLSFVFFALASYGLIQILWGLGSRLLTSSRRLASPELIRRLREYANEFSNLHIEFANHTHQVQAKELSSVFELAGWKTNLSTVPLEMGRPDFYEGIEVSGHNNHLVRTVEIALREAGLAGTRVKITPPGVDPTSPKYPSTQNRINIIIGHPKA